MSKRGEKMQQLHVSVSEKFVTEFERALRKLHFSNGKQGNGGHREKPRAILSR